MLTPDLWLTARQDRSQSDLHFAQVCLSLIPCLNLPVTIDQKRHRQTKDSAVEVSQLYISHGHGVIQLQFVRCFTHEGRVVIHGNSDDLEAAWTIRSLPGHKGWHLNLAGSAPCGPEVEQHHFAPISLEV